MRILSFIAAFIFCAAGFGAEPRLIVDLNPGSAGSYPSNFTTFADRLYFTAYTQATGFELWKSDGATVELVRDINDTADDIGFGVLEGNDSFPSWLTEFNGVLYFSAYEPRRGAELWSYNGTAAARVTDLSPDMNDTIKFNPNSSWPNQLIVFNNALYFSASSGTISTNYELFKYDGVSAQQVANIHPDIGQDFSSYPKGMTIFNGALYFMANDGAHGYELWKHDGVSTVMMDLNPGGAESDSFPKNFRAFNGKLYFQAYDAEHGFELWETDGATARLVMDINPGPAMSAPEFLTEFNGALYFRADDGTHGYELWKFDGVTPTLAADVNPLGDSYPKNLTVFDGALYFAADDGTHGYELWKYDGASAALVRDLNTAGDSFPESLLVANGALYFGATTPETGYEPFKLSAGTIAPAADINPGPGDSFPQFFFVFHNELVFRATSNGTTDWEPWALALQAPMLPVPEILATMIETGGVRIRWKTTGGAINTVQAAATVDGQFTDISEPVTIPGSGETTAEFVDPTPLGEMRFYRIRQQ